MSQENVEAIRRAYEAYNRGDLESMVVDIAPEFEYETTGAVPGTHEQVLGVGSPRARARYRPRR